MQSKGLLKDLRKKTIDIFTAFIKNELLILNWYIFGSYEKDLSSFDSDIDRFGSITKYKIL